MTQQTPCPQPMQRDSGPIPGWWPALREQPCQRHQHECFALQALKKQTEDFEQWQPHRPKEVWLPHFQFAH